MNDQPQRRQRAAAPAPAPAPAPAVPPVKLPAHVVAYQHFQADMESMRSEIESGLKQMAKGVDPKYWLDLLYAMVKEQPELLDCEPASIRFGVGTAARLGLMLDKHSGHAYLVPYNDKRRGRIAQFILGYKGILLLAQRSPDVSRIIARAVNAGDEFDYWYGLEDNVRHKPQMASKKGRELTHVYAIAHLKDGSHQFVVLDRSEVEAVRARSKASSGMSPWSTDFEAMAKKTAIRNLARWLPLDNASRRAIDEDEGLDLGEPEFRESEPITSDQFAAALAAQMAPMPKPEIEQQPRDAEVEPEPEEKPEPGAREPGEDDDYEDGPIANLFPDQRDKPLDPERRK